MIPIVALPPGVSVLLWVKWQAAAAGRSARDATTSRWSGRIAMLRSFVTRLMMVSFGSEFVAEARPHWLGLGKTETARAGCDRPAMHRREANAAAWRASTRSQVGNQVSTLRVRDAIVFKMYAVPPRRSDNLSAFWPAEDFLEGTSEGFRLGSNRGARSIVC